MWDIITLYSFCVNRGIGILTLEDKNVIRNMIIDYDGISLKRRNKLFVEKERLLLYIEGSEV
jgi:hypothetical protein